MSETTAPRHVLHLVIEGFPAERATELNAPSSGSTDIIEVLPLTEANAREALEKIFAADMVAVWGKV
jgi:hypothetical protein